MSPRAIGALLLALTHLPGGACAAQNPGAEREIRTLEERERSAVLAEDTLALRELWAPQFMVNNPSNTIAEDRSTVFALIAAGRIRHLRFERRIEAVRIEGDLAIVMGGETVVSREAAGQAGAPVERRFSHVWVRTSSGWRLVARHANRVPAP